MSHISLHQFFNEKKSTDGTPLTWPGANGFPFAGKEIPDLVGDQAENLPLRVKFHSGLFKMWDEVSKAAYDDVCNHIASGVWMRKKERERWVDQGMEIWLEWYEVANEVIPRGPGNALALPR